MALRKPSDPPADIRYIIHKGYAAAAELALTTTEKRKLFVDTMHAELEKDFCSGCQEPYKDCTCPPDEDEEMELFGGPVTESIPADSPEPPDDVQTA